MNDWETFWWDTLFGSGGYHSDQSPTFYATGTGYADSKPPTDWTWMLNPYLDSMQPTNPTEDWGSGYSWGGNYYGGGSTEQPGAINGGGGGGIPANPPADQVMPLPDDQTDEVLMPPWDQPPVEPPVDTTTTWDPQPFPPVGTQPSLWELAGIIGAAGGAAGAATGAGGGSTPTTTSPNPDTAGPEIQWDPEQFPPPDSVDITGMFPPFSVTHTETLPGQQGTPWDQFTPVTTIEPVPSEFSPALIPDVFTSLNPSPFPQTGGPIMWPWVSPTDTPTTGGGAVTPVAVAKPGSKTEAPKLPSLDAVGGSGAPGPGPLAPVVGDPNAKQSVFSGTYQPQDVQPFSEILNAIINGAYYA